MAGLDEFGAQTLFKCAQASGGAITSAALVEAAHADARFDAVLQRLPADRDASVRLSLADAALLAPPPPREVVAEPPVPPPPKPPPKPPSPTRWKHAVGEFPDVPLAPAPAAPRSPPRAKTRRTVRRGCYEKPHIGVRERRLIPSTGAVECLVLAFGSF